MAKKKICKIKNLWLFLVRLASGSFKYNIRKQWFEQQRLGHR